MAVNELKNPIKCKDVGLRTNVAVVHGPLLFAYPYLVGNAELCTEGRHLWVGPVCIWGAEGALGVQSGHRLKDEEAIISKPRRNTLSSHG